MKAILLVSILCLASSIAAAKDSSSCEAAKRIVEQYIALDLLGEGTQASEEMDKLIEFPWSALMDNASFEGYFKLWFMSNAFEWAISGFYRSSRTQLLGAIKLNGQTYDLIVADTAISDNDGDLTNDGICLRRPAQKALAGRMPGLRPESISMAGAMYSM